MASPIASLVVEVGADISGATRGLSALNATISGFTGSVLKTGAVLGATLGVGAAAVFVPAIKGAGDLEQSVANISTIAPDIDTSQVFASLNEMSTRIPQSATQLGDALYNIFSSIDVDQFGGLKLAETFAKGATAAQTDANTFGTAILGVMNAYGLSVNDAAHVTDVFFNTVNKGVVNGQELAASLGLVTATAKAASVDLDTLGGLIVGVTKQGGPAAQNINNLANFLAKVNTKQAIKGFTDLGVRTVDSAGNFRTMTDILADSKKALDKLAPAAKNAAINKIFPDFQARTGFQTLMDQLGNVNEAIGINRTQSGSAEEAYKRMVNTFNNQSKLLGNAVTAAFTTLGAELLPHITPVVSAIADNIPKALDTLKAVWAAFTLDPGALGIFLDNIRDWFGSDVADTIEPFVQKLMAGIPGLKDFATSGIATLGEALRTNLPAIAAGAAILFTLVNPIGALALASAGLAVAWGLNWDNMRQKTLDAVLGITGAIRQTLLPNLQVVVIGAGILTAILGILAVQAIAAGAALVVGGLAAAAAWAAAGLAMLAAALPVIAIMGAVLLLIVGMAKLKQAWDANWGGMRDTVTNIAVSVLATLQDLFQKIGNALGPFGPGGPFLDIAKSLSIAQADLKEQGVGGLVPGANELGTELDSVNTWIDQVGQFKDQFGQGLPDLKAQLGGALTGIDLTARGASLAGQGPPNRAAEFGLGGAPQVNVSIGQINNDADVNALIDRMAQLIADASQRATPAQPANGAP